MSNVRIDVLHWLGRERPSVQNLTQGLEAASSSWDVQLHSLGYAGRYDGYKSIRGGVKSLKAWQTIARTPSLRRQSDVLVVHKQPHAELVEYCFGISPVEAAIGAFDPVVFSVYDAVYLDYPEKTRRLFERADLVYATSQAIVDEARRHVEASKITYIPPSVDTTFFTPGIRPPDRLQTGSLVLGWVGDASVHLDNIDLLLDRLATIDVSTDWTLRLLLGGGTLSPELEAKAADLAVDVEVIGRVPWADVPAVINSMDVGLAPLTSTELNRARSSEKVREYMACGIPVIGSNVGENRQLIADGTGILVESDREWERAISRLSDTDVRGRMGRQARAHVVDNYSIPVIGDRIYDEFTALLE